MGENLGFNFWEVGFISPNFICLKERQSRSVTQDYTSSLKRGGLNYSQELPASVPLSPGRTKIIHVDLGASLKMAEVKM